MKYKTIVTAALCATSPIAAQAIELTDFTDPNTQFDEAYVDFSASLNDGNQDQMSYAALLNGYYNRQQSTHKNVFGLQVEADLNGSRGPNSGDKSVDSYGFSIDASRDSYFSETNDKLFYFLQGSYGHQSEATDDNLSATVGIGYGRVWDATALAKALRIEEALANQGLLASDIDDDSLIAIANIIGKQNEYRSKEGEDNYRGVWYADIEQVLVASGALADEQLSAMGTIQLDDVLIDEVVRPRRHGWLVRAGAGFQSSDLQGLVDNDPKFLIQAEYAKPYGLRGQLINMLTYEPVFGDNTVQVLNNSLTYTYEVSDRIDWLNSWDLSYQKSDGTPSNSLTKNVLSSSFVYELTNRLDLALVVSATDVNQKPDTDTSDDDINTAANLNLRYRVK